MMTTSQPPVHRTGKGAQRIQALTHTAAELFLERGFASVSVDDLIACVGGSRRNVYSHFGGKEGLFIEAVTGLCQELAHPLETLVIEQTDPAHALTRFGRILLDTVLQPRTLELHRLMVSEGKRFPQLAQAISQAGHFKAGAILATWIESHRKTRRKDCAEYRSAGTLAQQYIDLVVNDIQLRALTGLQSLPVPSTLIDRIVDDAVHTFLHGAASKEFQ